MTSLSRFAGRERVSGCKTAARWTSTANSGDPARVDASLGDLARGVIGSEIAVARFSPPPANSTEPTNTDHKNSRDVA